MKLPRITPPTREGWWFLIVTVLVGAIAIDAGLNLFFLAFATMVCLIAAGIAVAEATLAGLRVRRVLPPAVFVGTPYLMGIALENQKRRLPSFSIEVEDLVDGRPIDKRCYFLKLPAGRTQETAYRHTPARRGPHRLTGFRLATKFPFGLAQRARVVPDAQEICVYPALAPPPPSLLRGLPARPGIGHEKRRGREGDFAGLRAFRPGDDPRDIHWRTSARRGLPMVREHEDDQAREATVLLDNSSAPSSSSSPSPSPPAKDPFELAVSQAAGVCVELNRRGFAVALRTRGGEVRADVGPAQIDRLLRALALIAPESGPMPAPGRGINVLIRPGAPPQLDLAAAGRARPRSARGGSGA